MTALIAGLIAGLIGWQAWRARAPFGSAESAARLNLAVGHNGSDSSTASATLAETLATVSPDSGLDLSAVTVADPGRPFAVGRVEYGVPAGTPTDAMYSLFVIDRRSGRPVSLLFGGHAGGAQASSGWDGRYDELGRTEPWLEPLRSSRQDHGSMVDPGSALLWPAADAGPLIFVAYLGADSLPIQTPSEDLLVVLALSSPGLDRFHWAVALTPS